MMKIIQRSSHGKNIKNGTRIRGEKLKVLVVTGIEELEKELELIEEHEMHFSMKEKYRYLLNDLQHIETVVEKDCFDVAVINRHLDQSDDGEVLVKLFTRIKNKNPLFRFILILSDYDERVVYPLVNAGIYDLIIDGDISKSEIIKVIDEPAKSFDFSKYQVTDEQSKKININLPSFTAKEKWKSKKVITSYSPFSKGASEFAVALAKTLSKKSDKVCLVDFDYLRPSIKEKLSLKGSQGLKDAIELARHNNLSSKNIHAVLDKKDNFSVLTGLYDLNEIYYIEKSYFERILEVLKSSFEFLIIDVHSYHDLKANFVAFEKSDVIYTITTGDKKTLDNTMRYINMFDAYEDAGAESVQLIINHYGGNDLTSIEIENIIKNKVYYLPNKEGGIFKRGDKKKYEKSLENITQEL